VVGGFPSEIEEALCCRWRFELGAMDVLMVTAYSASVVGCVSGRSYSHLRFLEFGVEGEGVWSTALSSVNIGTGIPVLRKGSATAHCYGDEGVFDVKAQTKGLRSRMKSLGGRGKKEWEKHRAGKKRRVVGPTSRSD